MSTVQGQYSLFHQDTGNVAHFTLNFDGKNALAESQVVEAKREEPQVGELTEFKILCPYCSAPYSARMETDFTYSMGSEWTGIYGEETTVKIYCDNCKKLVYTKD